MCTHYKVITTISLGTSRHHTIDTLLMRHPNGWLRKEKGGLKPENELSYHTSPLLPPGC